MPLLGGSHQHIAITFGMDKLEWCGYIIVKKNLKVNYSFRQNTQMLNTDGHCVTA